MHPTEDTNLSDWIEDVRVRIPDLVAGLTDEQLIGPQLNTVNPLQWEIGHVAWFFEKWVVREAAGRPSLMEDSDALYDSIAIAHDTRWDLTLPNRQATFDYLNRVLDTTLELLAGDPSPEVAYHTTYCIYHADMHTEAFTYTLQTHGLPFPETARRRVAPPRRPPVDGDIELSGGTFQLGADPDTPFCFDNEKWAHPIKLKRFAIAKVPVTQGQYAEFCDDGGYENDAYWSKDGLAWKTEAKVKCPVYWKKYRRKWQRRHFDEWVPLEPDHPVMHVNWHEASAYCEWADRRLPTEAEWEAAASVSDPSDLKGPKHLYPWGNLLAPDASHTDWACGGTSDVGAYLDGESAAGCRQMLGNVWEWTSSPFEPYPGFVADPYKEYSEPWFKTRKVLRGGSWATRDRMLWNTWRNYFTPDRRDVFAGFRTCAK